MFESRKYRRFLATLVVCTLGSALPAGAHYKVVKTEDGYSLAKDGVPFVVKGAGLFGVDLESVVRRGGNSIRTWGIEEAQETLDAAEKVGLSVLMGLPVAAERFGFDYDDPASIELQRGNVREAVEQWRDHPALMGWIIGNELDMSASNLKAYDEVNELSKMIHALDPNHVTTTTIASFEREIIESVREQAPDLDFISLQAYGALALMPKAIRYLREGPFMITEWGPLGHWEVGRTRWDAPVEHTSTEKGRHYLASYINLIQPFLGPGLGSYAFLWGHKQERTHTWFSLFSADGESTAAVDALEFVWTGTIRGNQAPVLNSLTLARRTAHDSVRLRAGRQYTANVDATDSDEDPLRFQWQVKPESTETAIGGDFEESISDVEGIIPEGANEATLSFNAPAEAGEYRLFVTVYDGHGNIAHANLPFLVFGKKR